MKTPRAMDSLRHLGHNNNVTRLSGHECKIYQEQPGMMQLAK